MNPSHISLVTGDLGGLTRHLIAIAKAHSSSFIISDARIRSLVSKDFDSADAPWKWLVLACGESGKCLSEASRSWEFLRSAGADRGSLIIALGGGAVGDLAGFVAATYMRGIDIIQVPTTLLAMVDASVGGKTGIDFAGSKNLIGAFNVAKAVYICPRFLATLDDRQYRAGLAEMVKHSVISGLDHVELLRAAMPMMLERDEPTLEDMIALSIRVKGEIIERDPWERGERALLNWGHTFGHAVEELSDFTLLHGEAVAIGMSCAAWASCRLGLVDSAFVEAQDALLHQAGLCTRIPESLSSQEMLRVMLGDKKARNGKLALVLAHGWGHLELHPDVSLELVLAALEAKRESERPAGVPV